MMEKSKKKKMGVIREEDVSILLQRYNVSTLLSLLQEIFLHDGIKFDWNALSHKSSTGISNAREFQMVWRHLAYRHQLLENLDDGAQPLDDDSDLEYEMEPFPCVTNEASSEAAACVKVLIASGLSSDSSQACSTVVEAPLTVNIPNAVLDANASEISLPAAGQGMNITVPVSVQKHPLPSLTVSEALDGNGSAGGSVLPARKRKKTWSAKDDQELCAAVEKHGEGNWASILKCDFACDRTASQLSQRWAALRKQKNELNVGPTTNSNGLQLSEAQLAARHAMNLALDHPRPANSATNGTAKCQANSRSAWVKTSVMTADPIRAAAIAAGARIATQSEVDSLLKDAQAKNVMHLMPLCHQSSAKSSIATGASSRLFPPTVPQAAAASASVSAQSESGCDPDASPKPPAVAPSAEQARPHELIPCKYDGIDTPKMEGGENNASLLGNESEKQVDGEDEMTPGDKASTELGTDDSSKLEMDMDVLDGSKVVEIQNKEIL